MLLRITLLGLVLGLARLLLLLFALPLVFLLVLLAGLVLLLLLLLLVLLFLLFLLFLVLLLLLLLLLFQHALGVGQVVAGVLVVRCPEQGLLERVHGLVELLFLEQGVPQVVEGPGLFTGIISASSCGLVARPGLFGLLLSVKGIPLVEQGTRVITCLGVAVRSGGVFALAIELVALPQEGFGILRERAFSDAQGQQRKEMLRCDHVAMVRLRVPLPSPSNSPAKMSRMAMARKLWNWSS